MAGARWTRRSLADDANNFSNLEPMVRRLVVEAVSRVAEETEQYAKDEIQNNRGTGKSWTAARGANWDRTGASPGRDDTGRMRNAIKSTVNTGSTVQARVGWLDEYEDYFGYQEDGFEHQFAGAVKGMGLMKDVSSKSRDLLAIEADELMKKIDPWNPSAR